MHKQSQVAVFIILGMVFIVAFFAFYKLSAEPVDIDDRIGVDLKPAIESCLKNAGKDAILHIGYTGGYSEFPENATSGEFHETYYFYDSENLMPSMEKIESEISDYIDKEAIRCIDALMANITYLDASVGVLTSSVEITNDSMIIISQLPVAANRARIGKHENMFYVKLEDVRLSNTYSAIAKVMEKQMTEPGLLCLTCIADIAEMYNISIEVQRNGFDAIFTVVDKNFVIDDTPYYFVFANKYKQNSCNSLPYDAEPFMLLDCIYGEFDNYNYTLNLPEIPDQVAFVNRSFYFTINATGHEVSYSDSTELFDVDDGIIHFTPLEEDIGNHTIWVTVVDTFNNEASTNFLLKVDYE